MPVDTASSPFALRIATPLGLDLLVATDGDAITASDFVSRKRTKAAQAASTQPLLDEVSRQVKAYFARHLLRFDLPLRFEGTQLQIEIWRFVSRLRFAEVISYGDVGNALGRPHLHRAVAAAMGSSPFALFVPAHRVIGADGRIKGAGPNSLRRRLLIFEKRLTISGGDAIRPSARLPHSDPPVRLLR